MKLSIHYWFNRLLRATHASDTIYGETLLCRWSIRQSFMPMSLSLNQWRISTTCHHSDQFPDKRINPFGNYTQHHDIAGPKLIYHALLLCPSICPEQNPVNIPCLVFQWLGTNSTQSSKPEVHCGLWFLCLFHFYKILSFTNSWFLCLIFMKAALFSSFLLPQAFSVPAVVTIVKTW